MALPDRAVTGANPQRSDASPMKVRVIDPWLAPLTVLMTACVPLSSGPFSPTETMAHVSVLAAPEMQGRAAGLKDEARAFDYVVAQLDAAGIAAPPSGRVQPFSLGSRKSRNVYGWIPGSTGLADEYVVVGAHVDHLGVVDGELYPGAEDNASGVAVVIEVGKALATQRQRLGRSVLLAFFGAEEVGMVGSEAYVAAPPVPLEQTVAMVNVDMIGLPMLDQTLFWVPKVLWGIDDRRSVGLIGTEGRPGLRAVVNDACHRARIAGIAPEDFPDWIKEMINSKAKDRGDNAAFERAGVPAVFFGSGEADSYHSPDDGIDDIEPEIMAQRAHAIFETVVHLSRADWSFVRREASVER